MQSFYNYKSTKTGAEGFEPPHGGAKNRRLTTWRRPNLKFYKK